MTIIDLISVISLTVSVLSLGITLGKSFSKQKENNRTDVK